MKGKAMARKAWNNKKGSALLVAIVIMMVIMMLSLALLLVSYTLFSTANKQKTTEQCRELAQSLSVELQAEITTPNFKTWNEAEEARESGEFSLWFYLRDNVWQTSWSYYDAEERGRTGDYAYRYFEIDADGADAELMDSITVKMYWEKPEEEDQTEGQDNPSNRKNDTRLLVEVTCERGKQKSTITSTYELTIQEKSGGQEDNPDDEEIWTWGFVTRE